MYVLLILDRFFFLLEVMEVMDLISFMLTFWRFVVIVFVGEFVLLVPGLKQCLKGSIMR